MAWTDRIQQAAYTPAGGQRIVFDFTDVTVERDLKGTAFNFPDADGTLVQRTGQTGRRYPLRVYLSGPDYDLAADAFFSQLSLPGVGKLEHPVYGTVDVVPFGTVKRNDALATAANQAVVEVTFWATVGVAYPTAQGEPTSSVRAAVDRFNAAAASQLEGATPTTPTRLAAFQAQYEALLDSARAALAPVASATESANREFNAVYDAVSQGIDVLVRDPLTLAFQTTIMLEAPARSTALFADRLQAYRSLAETVFGQPSRDVPARDFYASAAVAATSVAVLNTQFETRTQALDAAEQVLQLNAAVTDWRDPAYSDAGEVDTGGQYQAMQEATALTAGFLVEISFTLQQERRLTLPRARTVIDLVAELYGEVDARLDFFIDSNTLAWDELLELPAGREVVYYV